MDQLQKTDLYRPIVNVSTILIQSRGKPEICAGATLLQNTLVVTVTRPDSGVGVWLFFCE